MQSGPDEFGLVRVVQRHQQLGVFPDVADEVLQVHEQTVGVHGAEQSLTPHLQVLKARLHKGKVQGQSTDGYCGKKVTCRKKLAQFWGTIKNYGCTDASSIVIHSPSLY